VLQHARSVATFDYNAIVVAKSNIDPACICGNKFMVDAVRDCTPKKCGDKKDVKTVFDQINSKCNGKPGFPMVPP
jgi:CFEM domain